MNTLSPLARQLYESLHIYASTHYGAWAGRESEMAALARLSYPIDRAILCELLDAKLVEHHNIGPMYHLRIFDESEVRP